MALYKDIQITTAGETLLQQQILTGTNPLTFTAIAIGDGVLAEGTDTASKTALVHEVKRLQIETQTVSGGKVTMTARLATDSITAGIYHREIGVYVGNTLFAYGNTGAEYDFIPPAGENAAVSKTIKVTLIIGSAQVTFAELDTSELVTYDALEQRIVELATPAVETAILATVTNSDKVEITLPIDQTFTPESENAQSGVAIASVMGEHAGSDTHITAAERTAWNSHAGDAEIHMSGNERAKAHGGKYITGDIVTSIMSWNGFSLTSSIIPHGQKIKSISVQIAGIAANVEGEMFTTVYAAAYAKDGDAFSSSGTETLLGVSDNAVTVEEGNEAKWTFAEGITVPEGKHLRITFAASLDYITASKVTTLPNLVIWVYCSNRESTSMGDISAELELQGHIEDADIHVTEAERTKWNEAASAASNTDTTAKVYTSYDELLDDDYGEVNHILFADKMPAGTRAAFKVGADLEAPLDQFGFLEIVKFDGQFALLTFTAYETDAEYYYPSAQYVAITDNAQVGEWKKITYSNI